MNRAFMLAIGCAAVAAPPLSGQEAQPIERLAWLRGCWEAASPQRTIEEQWMVPRGGTMVGMSRTVRAGRLTGHELIVLREEGGTLVYQAYPSGQATTEFPARTVSDSSAVFENPDHDFPQRVGYRPVGTDSLLAWIEGSMGGQTRRIEFRYRRTPCPGS